MSDNISPVTPPFPSINLDSSCLTWHSLLDYSLRMISMYKQAK